MSLLPLLLFALQAAQNQQPAKQPEFVDEPQFVVSGVKDYTYRGGHGSDAVLRSTEGLTKAAASLRKESTLELLSLSQAAATKATLQEQIKREPTDADLHRQLADMEERLGNSLDAVREYQRAAELQGSEINLFDWGAELLKHHAGEPATEVFAKGVQTFPGSLRMKLGLAIAFYLTGQYDGAAQQFFAAADEHPQDPMPYLFLGQVQAKEITESLGYSERMERFARIQPQNASAHYFYAACLWAHRSDLRQVKLQAQKAVELDGHLTQAYLLLGTVGLAEKNLAEAIAMLRKTVALDSQSVEGHYRLAGAYELAGDKAKAQEERAIYKRLSHESAQATEEERKNLRQFVFTLREVKPASEK